MGLTDNANPFGLIPFLQPFLLGRRKRSIPDPDIPPHKIQGGERAFLYEVCKVGNLHDATRQA